MALLLAFARLLVAALLGTASLTGERGLATRFGDPGDYYGGQPLYCTREKMKPGQLACAHRSLPCGSLVVLHNPRTSRFAVCEVLDRGPFGAILPSGDWGLKLSDEQPGKWRGIIDIAPAVAEALDFNGREKLQIIYQQAKRVTRIYGPTPTRRNGVAALLAARAAAELAAKE